MLGNGKLTQQQSTELMLIYRNARRLLRLINSILDFSRAAAGKMDSTFTPLPLSLVTSELAASFKSTIENANIEYIVESTMSTDQLVFVDLQKYERICYNLISNAFKFTRTGHIKIRTSIADNGSNFLLEVEDTGIGIPTDQLPLIFERFHRVESKEARVAEGSGIGLSLCLEFVKLLGGRMSVDSVEGQGSTFSVSLPLGSQHLPKNRLVMPSQEPGQLSKKLADTVADFTEDVSGWTKPGTASIASTNDTALAVEDVLFPPILFNRRQGRERPHVLLAEDSSDMVNQPSAPRALTNSYDNSEPTFPRSSLLTSMLRLSQTGKRPSSCFKVQTGSTCSFPTS
jgi:hypothetical protein